MLPPSDEQRREWMAQWRSAAVALAQVRVREIQTADLARIANDLEDACLVAAAARAGSTTSGLIAQQRYFRRGHV